MFPKQFSVLSCSNKAVIQSKRKQKIEEYITGLVRLKLNYHNFFKCIFSDSYIRFMIEVIITNLGTLGKPMLNLKQYTLSILNLLVGFFHREQLQSKDLSSKSLCRIQKNIDFLIITTSFECCSIIHTIIHLVWMSLCKLRYASFKTLVCLF